MFRLLLCLLSSNIQANNVPGRNVCGNGKCCRIFTEGEFQGKGCIVNLGLRALLSCPGQRHQGLRAKLGPRSNYSQEQLLSKLQPEHQQRLLSKSLQEIHVSKNKGRLRMLHQSRGRSSSCRASSCENAPAVKEQTDPGSARLDQTFHPKILQSPEGFQLHPHSNGALVLRDRWGPSLRAPSEPPAPRCPWGHNCCWQLLLGRGLEVGNGDSVCLHHR